MNHETQQKHRCDNAREIVCLYKISTHSAPSDQEMPSRVDPYLRSVPVFLHRPHIQALKFFCFEIDHNNNKASRNWNLSSPSAFLLPANLRFVYHCIDQVQPHSADPFHAAWQIIVWPVYSSQVQQHFLFLMHNEHLAPATDLIYQL